MTKISALCVYCASSERTAPHYLELARALGRATALRGIELVYGGGRVGLMGAAADAALDAGGRVTGIIPDFLHDRELQHEGLSELLVVTSMHERKRIMFERSQAFVILPGGLGTLDETFEILTWRQIGLHELPVVLLNHQGYWDPLLAMLERQVAENMVRPEHAALLSVAEDIEGCFSLLEAAPPTPEKGDPELL